VTAQPDEAPRRTRNPRGEGERLRNDLVAAADRLLREGHTHETLSLRAVARQVGIATTSIYLHFPDKVALLLAVYERHFADLADRINQAVAAHAEPGAQLRATARAYWQFAADHPDAYHVMFTVPSANDAAALIPADRRPGAAVIAAVQAVITRCIETGATHPTDPYNATLCLWTSLHGLITMMAARPFVPWPPVDSLLDTLLDTYLSPTAGGATSGRAPAAG
jgi:AcrR family transcriptional regulator